MELEQYKISEMNLTLYYYGRKWRKHLELIYAATKQVKGFEDYYLIKPMIQIYISQQ